MAIEDQLIKDNLKVKLTVSDNPRHGLTHHAVAALEIRDPENGDPLRLWFGGEGRTQEAAISKLHDLLLRVAELTTDKFRDLQEEMIK